MDTKDETRTAEVVRPFNTEAVASPQETPPPEVQPQSAQPDEQKRYYMFIKTPLLYLNMKRFPRDPLYKNCLRSVRYSTEPPHHWGKAAPSYKPWE